MFKIIALLLLLAVSGAVSVHAESLRDPTRPLGYRGAEGTPIEWELNAVFIGGTRKLAVINGQKLQEQERVPGSAGVYLLAIEPRAVVLQQGPRTWRVHLAGNEVRRRATTDTRAEK